MLGVAKKAEGADTFSSYASQDAIADAGRKDNSHLFLWTANVM